MLGEAFHRLYQNDFELRCTDIDLNEAWIDFCDFREFKAYRDDVKSFKPDYLFHIGAYTDLEYCETHPDETYLTNTLAVENAAAIANELDIPLLYIGTAGIFDGTKDLYDDWDVPNPLGHYARSKYAGEIVVQQATRRHLICRAGWMMGGGPAKDKKFIQKLMQQLKDGAHELFIVNDRLGTPTYTHDFVGNVRLLLRQGMWGLYNMVCGGVTSRLEVARELLNCVKLSHEVTIREVSSEYFRQQYFALRPASERLLNRKLNLRGLNVMRDWRVALRSYVSEYYGGYL